MPVSCQRHLTRAQRGRSCRTKLKGLHFGHNFASACIQQSYEAGITPQYEKAIRTRQSLKPQQESMKEKRLSSLGRQSVAHVDPDCTLRTNASKVISPGSLRKHTRMSNFNRWSLPYPSGSWIQKELILHCAARPGKPPCQSWHSAQRCKSAETMQPLKCGKRYLEILTYSLGFTVVPPVRCLHDRHRKPAAQNWSGLVASKPCKRNLRSALC